MNQDRVVLPFFDVDLQEHLLFLVLKLPENSVLDVSLKPLLVVVVELFCFVELVAYLQNDSIVC
jgi:hypothetical protein